MGDPAELLPGTLDVLILKAVSLRTVHCYGALLRIEQITGGALQVQQGALYPALGRLEHNGLLSSEWGVSSNNRRAKFYAHDGGTSAAGRGGGELAVAGGRGGAGAGCDGAGAVT